MPCLLPPTQVPEAPSISANNGVLFSSFALLFMFFNSLAISLGSKELYRSSRSCTICSSLIPCRTLIFSLWIDFASDSGASVLVCCFSASLPLVFFFWALFSLSLSFQDDIFLGLYNSGNPVPQLLVLRVPLSLLSTESDVSFSTISPSKSITMVAE
ncbi:hypothetical protein NG271_806 [Saccharomyces cerevisiae synthetic construct]|uniref:Putative uncharacterized protein YDR526C n=3 Tax=Saccharomyces cerevisiae TaxID=4932 RepID=YD526_YEAST|nr:RecName: Full=Putative uncharacterized protein YDR526C [Saccharomyces cerevisiae S288C]AAB64979.1 Ydr526cp [Saccharomyces cerevisiae]EDZ72740.1 hypothetical protein AWRI1631_47370 [Saccharomyces cerevisiae AWRI1631]WNF20354.1 hypothetical protein NG271_806 [Saccharomyces cerevisiae synthetic construct]CAY79025.1 EC1118_1D0_8493p [Saccharomyces cerevisiae EC1118]KZV12771.1 hypothetical protein WN66_01620 [Saccharomyces cerevisiae]